MALYALDKQEDLRTGIWSISRQKFFWHLCTGYSHCLLREINTQQFNDA